MGDLSTHREIYRQTVQPMLRARLGLPASDSLCFELGNWLRDVSQFRDPCSNQKNKLLLLLAESYIKREAARKVLDEIFGPHFRHDAGQPVISGAFGEWFRQMLMGIGALTFAPKSPGPYGALAEPDFKRLFDRYFTQYFPHEHLDFPPPAAGQALGDWNRGSVLAQPAVGGTRRVLAYLDEYIDYVATWLTQTESTLKALSANPLGSRASERQKQERHAELQNALVQWGRVSHAVEDFYFHSNFCEIAFLRSVGGPDSEKLELNAYFALPTIGALGEAHKRKLFRRLRAPQLQTDSAKQSVLSTSTSMPARFVFTGMFDKDDVLHTFSDAFDGAAFYANVPGVLAMLDSALLSHVFDPGKRKKLVQVRDGTAGPNDAAINAVAATHVEELRAGKLPSKADKLADRSALFVACIRRAWAIDLEEIISTKGQANIGYVLLNLAARAESAAQNSARLTQKMNDEPRDEHYIASNNGNSAESVATHTLLAKDSVRKEPLRRLTEQYAHFAVGRATSLMVTQVAARSAGSQAVDWSDWIRRLLCHPAQAPGDWAMRFLRSEPPPDAIFRPKLLDQAQVESALPNRMRQIGALEQTYFDRYAEAKRDWDEAVR